MRIKIDGQITIHDCDARLSKILKARLTLVNPKYKMFEAMVENETMGRGILYTEKKEFEYYVEHGNCIVVPRGCADLLKRSLKQLNLNPDIEIDRVYPAMGKPLPTKVSLKEWQEGKDETILSWLQGILKLGTAWGKTYIAFKLIERTQKKTLIICCKSQTSEMHKYKKDFKKEYGYDIGVIQGKKTDIKDVTVTTRSTLTVRGVMDIADKFGLIIVDEIQSSASDKFRKVLSCFKPARFYGMTGTPTLSNGQSQLLKFMYGDIIVEGEVPQVKPEVHVYKTNVDIDDTTFALMSENAATNLERNELIAKVAREAVAEGRKTLILVKHIDHGIELERLLHHKYGIDSYSFSSQDSAKDRVETVQAFRDESKDFEVLIGTYGLFSTGVDIPILSCVILAMSVKVDKDHSATLLQSIGRALRLHETKKDPIIIDIHDNQNKIMHKHFLSRKREYKARDYKIIYK